VSQSIPLPVLQPLADVRAADARSVNATGLLGDARSCTLSQCRPGSRATVIGLDDCGADEACRLRALGLCEGTAVSVIDARHAMVLDVRGTRLAIGSSLTAGITVQPHAAPSARA
jgi:Fe2+ transport system protein FeoA